MTVHDLRKNGYKVRVLHCRKFCGNSFGAFKPKGGSTVVQITTPEGVDLEGVSRCSDKDLYNKKLGVKVAIGRAFYSKVGLNDYSRSS